MGKKKVTKKAVEAKRAEIEANEAEGKRLRREYAELTDRKHYCLIVCDAPHPACGGMC